MDGNQVTVFTQFNSLDKVERTVEKEMSLADLHSLGWLTATVRCGTQPGSGSTRPVGFYKWLKHSGVAFTVKDSCSSNILCLSSLGEVKDCVMLV